MTADRLLEAQEYQMIDDFVVASLGIHAPFRGCKKKKTKNATIYNTYGITANDSFHKL